jgi:hypothetical protein
MREYADPVIDLLDAGRGILVRRLFRDVGPIFILIFTFITSVTVMYPAAKWVLYQGSDDGGARPCQSLSRRQLSC